MTEGDRTNGFGFVCFSSLVKATTAVTELNGRIIVAKHLYVRIVQWKEDKKAYLFTQHMQNNACMQVN